MKTPAKKTTPRKYVIVRTYSAGVHAGYLKSREGKEVELEKAVRIWAWQGAFSLNEIALSGVGAGSKIGKPVVSIVLTEAIEIIASSETVRENLEGFAK